MIIQVSITIVVPRDCIVWHLLLDQRLGLSVVTSTEPLRITIDNYRLVTLIDVDSPATWARWQPLLSQFLIRKLLVIKLLQNVSMVLTVEISTNQCHLLLISILLRRSQLNLDVLEHTVGVDVYRLDKLPQSLHFIFLILS